MIADCKANPVKYKSPNYVEFANNLPKCATGKIFRKEIRRMELVKAEKGGQR
jgi:acyl-coenzyme A synthetase/AMP-(fatty) acid ligase